MSTNLVERMSKMKDEPCSVSMAELKNDPPEDPLDTLKDIFDREDIFNRNATIFKNDVDSLLCGKDNYTKNAKYMVENFAFIRLFVTYSCFRDNPPRFGKIVIDEMDKLIKQKIEEPPDNMSAKEILWMEENFDLKWLFEMVDKYQTEPKLLGNVIINHVESELMKVMPFKQKKLRTTK